MNLATDLALGLDPVALAAAAGYVMDRWQQDAVRSRESQVCLLCSRQSGKTFTSAVLATYTVVAEPGSLVLLTAPNIRQAQECFRVCLHLLAAVAHRAALRQVNALGLELATGSRLLVIPGDAHDARTTRGFSSVRLLICDEASRLKDDVYYSLRPALAVSQGRIVLLSTPAGSRGFFHHEATSGASDWARYVVPASQCPRLSPAWLAAERDRIGRWWYAQEYECQFLDAEGALFRSDDIEAAVDDDLQPLFGAA
jgi:hypothetical protein